MQITTQITRRGRAEFGHIHDLVPWPDAHDPTYAVPLSDDKAWHEFAHRFACHQDPPQAR